MANDKPKEENVALTMAKGVFNAIKMVTNFQDRKSRRDVERAIRKSYRRNERLRKQYIKDDGILDAAELADLEMLERKTAKAMAELLNF